MRLIYDNLDQGSSFNDIQILKSVISKAFDQRWPCCKKKHSYTKL